MGLWSCCTAWQLQTGPGDGLLFDLGMFHWRHAMALSPNCPLSIFLPAVAGACMQGCS